MYISNTMKEPVFTPMFKVIFLAIKNELAKGGFVSLGKIIYAARYAYCEERLWRRVQTAEKEFAEGHFYNSIDEGLKDLQK